MGEMRKQDRVKTYVGWAVKRLTLILFDALVAYFSYFFALIVRFYSVNKFWANADEYLPFFFRFAPWYSAACVLVFFAFKLYNSRWKHAGLNDLNRIFLANLTTAVIQVAGTLLFTCRMPLTYYAIGAAIQFVLIAASRFSYRLFVLESAKVSKKRKKASINVMIVGTGETGRAVRRQIEHDSNNAAHPVCLFSIRDNSMGGLIDGIPVVTGINRLDSYFKKYKVQCVILADSIMPVEIRKKIKEICKAADVEVQDFSGYLTNEGRSLTLQKLMEYAEGPVEIVLEGQTQSFSNGEQALMEYPDKYDVTRIYVRDNRLGVEIVRRSIILNDINEDWVRETEQKTGNEISFF